MLMPSASEIIGTPYENVKGVVTSVELERERPFVFVKVPMFQFQIRVLKGTEFSGVTFYDLKKGQTVYVTVIYTERGFFATHLKAKLKKDTKSIQKKTNSCQVKQPPETLPLLEIAQSEVIM